VTTEPLDALLDKLSCGDTAAAEEVFRTYEPYLRMVVRRQLPPDLRAKFDSVDVVQSVWVHLLHGFRAAGWRFADRQHLRAFLIRLTRHRFIDKLRHHRAALAREESLVGPGVAEALVCDEPTPADVLQAEELWQELLELCPPAHQEVLRLKREGIGTGEIAARTGLHEGSVRRILHTLAQRLDRRRESESRPDGREP
jgi:RNA polymerase sigma-70 factor (ECF subfamily)